MSLHRDKERKKIEKRKDMGFPKRKRDINKANKNKQRPTEREQCEKVAFSLVRYSITIAVSKTLRGGDLPSDPEWIILMNMCPLFSPPALPAAPVNMRPHALSYSHSDC